MNPSIASREERKAGQIPASSLKNLEKNMENKEMLDYECGKKCRICPFPGAQCSATGMGNRE